MMKARIFGAFSFFLALGLAPSRARACGVSGVDGVSSCSLAEHDEALRPRWAVSASGLYTNTTLRFSGDLHAAQTREAGLAALAYMPTPVLTFQVGAGATFGGSLTAPDGRHDFSPGPTAFLGASWRVFDDQEFLLLTSLLSFSAAETQLQGQPSIGYEAFDLRLGAEFGTTLFGVLRPYVPVRVFGGPVYWKYQGESVTGTDTHHYQVGLGLGVAISRRIGLFAEGIPLGERALSLGVAATL
ncbi:MAG TPA: hypothetical protein VK745_01160 [Polyangiaceae bacterium]|jgi:hypothetical protein|nr:hypothetical protein [Polyangiaceae bacterium]